MELGKILKSLVHKYNQLQVQYEFTNINVDYPPPRTPNKRKAKRKIK